VSSLLRKLNLSDRRALANLSASLQAGPDSYQASAHWVRLNEELTVFERPAKVAAISVNSAGFTELDFRRELDSQTGVPVVDPCREGAAARGPGGAAGPGRPDRRDRHPDRRPVGRASAADGDQYAPVYVSRLRRLVGAEVLTTRRHGYELTVGDGDIDAGVFQQTVRRGRRELAAGRPARAGTARGQALALWDTPQPVLADVPPSPLVDALAVQLEQLRLGAVEDHAEARLQLGRHADLAEELDQLAREHPLRERRWALLMTALERCGRRADALEAYQRARRVLREELGLEPGRQLCELQQDILADDRGDGRRRRFGSPAGLASPAAS
jgi:DNA-binding SARP family transcriptional activator